MVVHYVPCAGQAVTAVRASLSDPDEGGLVIWEIMQAGPDTFEASGEQRPTRSVHPPDWRSRCPWRRPPPADAEVVVEVEVASEGGGTSTHSLTFNPGSSEPGRFLTLGGSKDPVTNREDALTTCEG